MEGHMLLANALASIILAFNGLIYSYGKRVLHLSVAPRLIVLSSACVKFGVSAVMHAREEEQKECIRS